MIRLETPTEAAEATSLDLCIALAHQIDLMHDAERNASQYALQEQAAATSRALCETHASHHESKAAEILAKMRLPRTFPKTLIQYMPT